MNDYTRRTFLAGAASVAAAGALASPLPQESGPIEAAWREFLRRERTLNGMDRDITDAENAWGMEPLFAGAGHPPIGSREWAALMLIALYTRNCAAVDPINAVLDTVEGILGQDAKVDCSIY